MLRYCVVARLRKGNPVWHLFAAEQSALDFATLLQKGTEPVRIAVWSRRVDASPAVPWTVERTWIRGDDGAWHEHMGAVA